MELVERIGNRSTTKVVHVGVKRYQSLSTTAISISAMAGRQVTASEFVKFIIDHYSEAAGVKLLSSIETLRKLEEDS